MPVEHFKSKEAYRKNLAYRHIHNIPFRAESVVVGGRSHRVKHGANAAVKKAGKRKPKRKSTRS